jgi:general secretion pathway protein K
MTPHPTRRQAGVALLTAMLTVTLVATFAAAAMWQQWRVVEVERAERTRAQMEWVLTGALDWARLILQEDARSGPIDHLSEPWALPLQEARLSSFLAVDKTAGDDALDAFFSGQITDQQALLNINNLVVAGERSPNAMKAFGRLFQLLNLPPAQLELLADNLLQAQSLRSAGSTAGVLPVPILPTRVAQIGWLGLAPATVQTLAPYVTVLPVPTPVNLNTAAAQVLCAVLPGLELGSARQLAAQRARTYFRAVGDAYQAAGLRADQADASQVAVGSRFFMVRGRLRLDQLTVQETSLVERQGIQVHAVWRQRDSSFL